MRSSFKIPAGDSWLGKPQAGTGLSPTTPVDVAATVVRLARHCDRGETPQLSLILECLDMIRGLELTATGGDALVWMLAPVLRTALGQLQHAAQERLHLEEEVSTLRLRSEQTSMDVEHLREWLRRAAETQAMRCSQRRESAGQLEVEADRVEHDLVDVVAQSTELRQQADEGLAVEREAWNRECIALEEETTNFLKEIQELDRELDLEEKSAQAEEQLVSMAARLKYLRPTVDKQTELSKRIDDREHRITELQADLAEIERKALERKASKKKKKPVKKKKDEGAS
mmetsp:Transcript_91740/g.296810  ORF Transcript_91740/g.296810 Transcript_91740/m.296810 type:complete len:286 (+) Transcript_91740:252-1109(+)